MRRSQVMALGCLVGGLLRLFVFGGLPFPVYAQAEEPVLVIDSVPGSGSSCPQRLTAYLSKLFFGSACEAESTLWVSNGTVWGTNPVQSTKPGQERVNATQSYQIVQNILYFTGYTQEAGWELWRTDGSDAGTYMVVDLAHFPSFLSAEPVNLTQFQNQLFFYASIALPTSEMPYYLLRSDGTAEGTVKISDVLLRGEGDIVPVGNTLFFTADSRGDAQGEALYKTDGTLEGTVLVSNIVAENEYSYIDGLTAFQNKLYFSAYTPQSGFELWQSDGTTSGTVLVKEALPGIQGVYPRELTVLGEKLLFSGETLTGGRELWMSDGTAAGTILLRDIYSGTESSSPAHLTPFQSSIIFSADDGLHGAELWRSDGTLTGTMLLKDIRTGVGSSLPSEFARVQEFLYFVADDGIHGRELWRSDGTADGTVLVMDIDPGRNGSLPTELTAVDDRLYFAATDRIHGQELWMLEPPITTYTAYLPLAMNHNSEQ